MEQKNIVATIYLKNLIELKSTEDFTIVYDVINLENIYKYS